LDGDPAVTGAGLANFADMSDMQWLFLEGTQIDDASLDHIAKMKKLEGFTISGTRVTDAGLKKLVGFEHMRWLTLNDLPLTDAAIPLLTAMKGLEDVAMNGTKVTDAGFQKLSEAGIKRVNHSP
jgi:internalin A